MASPAYTEQSLGKRGSEVITAASTGSFAIIVAGPAGATVSAITCTNKDNAAALITTLPAGYTSYGNFTAITVSAGSIEAYNA
tara:strand:+ start:1714 stop:1962 length:249 start_codon:yes stop_codon:yes gene_type:complete